MSAAEQARVFLIMLLLGAGACAARGAVGLLLRAMHAGPVLRGMADAASGAVCAAGIVAVSLALRIQAVRWYVFAGALAGAALAAGAYAASSAALKRLCALLAQRGRQKKK